MQAILFALISFLGWGIGDIFTTIAARKLDGYSVTFWVFLFTIPIYIPLIFFFPNINNITFQQLILISILALIWIGGIIAYYEGLRLSTASVVVTIASSFAAVSVVLSLIFLGDIISVKQAISILLIFTGVLLTTVDLNKSFVKNKWQTQRGNICALVAMLSWGIYFAFIKIPVQQIGWFWPTFISHLLFPVVFIFMKLRKIPLQLPTHQQAFLPILASALLTGGAVLSYNIAISQQLTAVVAPIAGSYATLFVALSFIIFKDPITKQQISGIIITLVGIVLLSFLSV